MTTLALPSASHFERLDPLNQALLGYLARCKSPKTLRSYQEDLKNYLAWCEDQQLAPLAVKRAHLDMYVLWMKAQNRWAESTIARRLGTVCGFYTYATFEDYIPRDPGVGVQRPTVDRAKQVRTFLAPVELAQLMKAAQRSSPTDHALVALLGMMGLRIAEACSLDITNLSRRGGHVVLSFIGKGNKAATVAVPAPVVVAINEVIGDRTEGPILLNQRGERMNQPAATRILKRLAKAADVPDFISPHSLRRTFCTTGLLMGVPLYEMQIAMRHTNPKTTAIYDMAQMSLGRNANHQVAGFLTTLVTGGRE